MITSLLRAPVSEMTYTVSSGTLWYTIPFLRQLLFSQTLAWANLPKNKRIGFFLDVREDMEFLEVLTEGLNRVLMVRGGGTEVITMYS